MLENQFLMSMPSITDTWFEKIVVYICEHSEHGAIGLIINCPTNYNLNFILDQLHIESHDPMALKKPVLFGGPVQQDRGFVIHRPIEGFNENIGFDNKICVSTSQSILRLIAKGEGPENSLITLGYAGWGANQLDAEIRQNIWLTCAANEKILYDTPLEEKWQKAINSLGFDVSSLVTNAGNA